MGASYLVLAASLAISAAQGLDAKVPPPQSPPAGAELAPLQTSRPYTGIFRAAAPQDPSSRGLKFQALEAAAAELAKKPRVVCGMVVVPVTPAADTKMLKQPPTQPQRDYKIRKIAPPICNE